MTYCDSAPDRRGVTGPLDGIDLVVFDKDGTLLDFHAMWGGWAIELGKRLDGATRRPVAGDVFATIGFDPTSGRVRAGAPLAVATMGEIQEMVAAVIRRWCPSVAAARQAVEPAWFIPDPWPAPSRWPTCPALFGALRDAAERSRSRPPTIERRPKPRFGRSASAISSRLSPVATTASASSPIPGCCSALCEAVRVPPDRTAVIGDTLADLRWPGTPGQRWRSASCRGSTMRPPWPVADLLLPSIADLPTA